MKKLIPFSNGSEAERWMSINCDSCKTKCHYKKNLEFGFISGEITEKTALFIGMQKKDNAIPSVYCKLNFRCNHKDKFVKKVSEKKDDDLPSLF